MYPLRQLDRGWSGDWRLRKDVVEAMASAVSKRASEFPSRGRQPFR